MISKMKVGIALLLAGACVPAFAQQISVAEAARRAREQRKESPRAKRVYGNDDLAAAGGPISIIGSVAPSGGDTSAAGTGAGAVVKSNDKTKNPEASEATWRKKFSELRAKIALKAKELDVTQRELNLKQQQYYSDPNVALREQYSRGDINDSRTKIDDMKRDLDAMKQQLSQLEDDLRRAGLPSSWSSE